MARLNEVPGPVESVDALKRRFVRQNRELARINSNQSVRIRNLESDISRLLSENITFRERVIKLQHELDGSLGQAAVDSVGEVRSKLETKLGELGDLMQELGKIQEGPGRQSSRRRSTERSSPKKSPDQRNWKNTFTLSEVTSASDSSRLPTIVEDKYFPRRTLEPEELLHGLNATNAIDSPDLGPPPVATFEEGDPIKYNSATAEVDLHGELQHGESMQLPCIANLETRKKRRESSHHLEARREGAASALQSHHAVATDQSVAAVQPLKAGAKRKLNIRDDEECDASAQVEERENFKFDRKTEKSTMTEPERKPTSSISKRSSDVSQPHPADRQASSSHPEKAKETVPISAVKTRKALGPKCINTDPVQSPMKKGKSVMSDKIDKSMDGKDSASKKSRDRDQIRAKSSSGKHHGTSKTNKIAEDVIPNAKKAVAQPETPDPLPLDFLSPQSSEKPASRPDSRDTPPPADLNAVSSTATTFGLEGRTTRRPRGSVSYAEPNLRDKMRRPTKDLIDAVGTDDRPQLIKVEEVNPAGTGLDRSRIRTIIVKQEDPHDETSSAWKNLPLPSDNERNSAIPRHEPPSPLSMRTPSAQLLPAELGTDGRDGGCHESAKEEIKSSSASGSTIAALVAGSQKTRRRECNERDEKGGESRDLFELHTSSPDEAVPKPQATASTRASRRHSSTVKNLDPKIASTITAESVLRRGDRRRESTLNRTERAGKQVDGESEPNGGGGSNEHPISVPTASLGISERSASRRRSMML